ncbi:hypothetical protein H696_01763 [Fonticula alba]|uniref:FYVE-type domain-containing protein n=1 Tax=Fonticula alba TaxID=691883 RepID=A0A058ZD83_FONAL|nr:hypothetical protein H696_01763 [Fonticula alba]KCV72370.1 hypothetical protein H696_01763 [Fonticula alba]|eukprot:XP_009493948.1 hypothetical protein H696_01763 [Fonticula alba]
MLLTDLIKNTEPTHVDYQPLRDALTQIETTARLVNETLRQHQSLVRAMSLRKSLSGLPSSEPLIIPGRSLLLDGVLMKVCRKTDQRRAFFLFSDILIYAAPAETFSSQTGVFTGLGGGPGIYAFSLPEPGTPAATALQVTLPAEEAVLPTSSQASYVLRKCFNLASVTASNVEHASGSAFGLSSPDKSFTVVAPSPEIRDVWVKAIQLACSQFRQNIQTLRPTTALSSSSNKSENESRLLFGDSFVAPIWVPDSHASSCMVPGCDTTFTIVRRRHHCRYCGKVVCQKCAPKRPEPRISAGHIRVCTPCLPHLLPASGPKKSAAATTPSAAGAPAAGGGGTIGRQAGLAGILATGGGVPLPGTIGGATLASTAPLEDDSDASDNSDDESGDEMPSMPLSGGASSASNAGRVPPPIPVRHSVIGLPTSASQPNAMAAPPGAGAGAGAGAGPARAPGASPPPIPYRRSMAFPPMAPVPSVSASSAPSSSGGATGPHVVRTAAAPPPIPTRTSSGAALPAPSAEFAPPPGFAPPPPTSSA